MRGLLAIDNALRRNQLPIAPSPQFAGAHRSSPPEGRGVHGAIISLSTRYAKLRKLDPAVYIGAALNKLC